MKTKTTKKRDAIDELEESLGKDLGEKLHEQVEKEIQKGPRFDEPEEEVEVAETKGSLVDKRVRFADLNGEPLTGKVISQEGEQIVILSDDEREWDHEASEVEVLGDGPGDEDEEDEDEIEKAKAPPAKVPAKVAPKPTKPEKASKPAETVAEAPEAGEPTIDPPFLLKISDVKVPRTGKPREVNKESADYQRILRDIKQWGQEDPIVVTSKEKPELIAGLTRLEILKDLGKTFVKARVRTVETENQRLYHGVRENHQRHQMHWLDTARAVATLVSGGEFSQAQVGRDLDIPPSELSRMLAAIHLPKQVLALAAQDAYPQSVFTELAAAPEPAKVKVQELMEAGSDVTVLSVREIAKEARAEEDAAAEEEGKPTRAERGHGGSRETKPKATRDRPAAPIYRDLTTDQLGEAVHFRVYGDRLEVSMTIPWDAKSFKGFDPIKAFKDLFNETYGNEAFAIRSHDDLAKALSEAKAEIG